LKPVCVHASYLINPATYKNEGFTIGLLKKELEMCELLDMDYYVIHPGSHLGKGFKNGLKNMVRKFKNLNYIKTKILIENQAGQTNSMCSSIQELAEAVVRLKEIGINCGYCFDTCHAYAYGYNISRNAEEVAIQLDKNLKEPPTIIHVNDSKHDLKSKRDNHAHIGEGKIGLQGFKHFLNYQYFKRIPLIIETPKSGPFGNYLYYDKVNISKLKQIVEREEV